MATTFELKMRGALVAVVVLAVLPASAAAQVNTEPRASPSTRTRSSADADVLVARRIRPAASRVAADVHRPAHMAHVVVISHDKGTLEALVSAIEQQGWSVAGHQDRGSLDELIAFLGKEQPRVVIYDLGPPPPEPASQRLRDLCSRLGSQMTYVITTSYPVKLELLPCVVESVLLEPASVDEVLEPVRRIMRETSCSAG